MRQFNQAIRYVISFLLQENAELGENVHYVTREKAITDSCKRSKQIYILQSGFFDDGYYGTEASLPQIPVQLYEGIRFLYGEAKEELLEGGSLLIHMDIIASAFFFLTRYEELVRFDVRDQHGRYPARNSIAYLSGGKKLTEPLVDEYGKLLCKKLETLGHQVKNSVGGFSKVWFTHDIDTPFISYSFKDMIKTIGKAFLYNHRLIFDPFLNWVGYYRINPQASWNYMLNAEKKAAREIKFPVESVCFIISTERRDVGTIPYINDKKIPSILEELCTGGAVLGLHTSYAGAEDEKCIHAEKEKLESMLGHEISFQRNHYLRQLHPSDMKWYEAAGFTDDFTMGYAGVAGFKLGTCHPVRFIDPADGSLHDIILHPLLIMDGSLSGATPYQMGLDFEHAKAVCKEIFNQVWRHHGEINVLFHNGMFKNIPGNYHKELYDWMLEYIIKLSKTE